MNRAADEVGSHLLCFSYEYYVNRIRFGESDDFNRELLSRSKLDGLLFLGWHDAKDLSLLFSRQRRNVPLFSVGKYYGDIACAYINGAVYVVELIRHLVDFHGYQDILFVPPYHPDDRNAAFRRELETRGIWNESLNLDEAILRRDGRDQEVDARARLVYDIVWRQRAQRPRAVLSMYSAEAMALVRVFQSEGLRVPEDVAVMTWEDAESGRFAEPSISALDYPWEDLGYYSVRAFAEQIRGDGRLTSKEVPCKFALRRSCGCSGRHIDSGSDENEAELFGSLRSLVKTVPEGMPRYSDFARIIEVEDAIYRSMGKHDTQNAQINQVLQRHGQAIVTSLSLTRLLASFRRAIVELEIPFSIVYVVDPKHDPAELRYRRVFTYGGDPGLSFGRSLESAAFFDPRLSHSGRHTYMILLLDVASEHYGFAVMEHGPDDERIYRALAVYLASALKTLMAIRSLNEVARNLRLTQETLLAKQRELEESNAKLGTLDQLKNDFIANITHDFRSPLTVILGLSELGRQGAQKTESDGKRMFQTVYEASLKLKAIVDRFLDLARMDSQGLRVVFRPVPLSSFLTFLADYYRSSVFGTKIRIETDLPKTEITGFYSDPDKLEEILNNLISNALKFVDSETGQVTLGYRAGPKDLRIFVRDNGSGIPRGKLETIFGRFEQETNGRESIYKGTGIGLAFCRQLAGFLGGTMSAFSRGDGRGSVFTITLPKRPSGGETHEEPWKPLGDSLERKSFLELLKAQNRERRDSGLVEDYQPFPQAEDEYDAHHGLILIAEDHADIRDLMMRILERAGYRNFALASDGKTALDKVFSMHPDLILSDIDMPSLRGDTFLKELRDNPQFDRVPFLFVSAVSDRDLSFAIQRKGALAFLRKPIDPLELLLNVDTFMTRRMEDLHLLRQAMVDELTGLSNRRDLENRFKAHVSRREFEDLGVVFFDIDYFKEINDKYGHALGDTVLRGVGACVRAKIRPSDVAARYGGDEFVVLLPGADLNGTTIVAQKLQAEIRSLVFDQGKARVTIRSTFGISSLAHNEEQIRQAEHCRPFAELYAATDNSVEWEARLKERLKIPRALLSLADAALYRAKSFVCLSCGHSSLSRDEFPNLRCPHCGSTSVRSGRDRIEIA